MKNNYNYHAVIGQERRFSFLKYTVQITAGSLIHTVYVSLWHRRS